MPNQPNQPIRIAINNRLLGSDYTGVINVGPAAKPLNVLLDTGSSTLAVDYHKYTPDLAHGDAATNLAQSVTYGSGSWAGAVVTSEVSIGSGADAMSIPNANLAIAYHESASMFGKADGILGLAYAPLDDAYEMASPTWPKHYTMKQIEAGAPRQITPYFSQLANAGLFSDVYAFYTRRTYTSVTNDDLNDGWLIVGGVGTDQSAQAALFDGPFQTVKVLSDDWYSTNLKQIIVGNSAPIDVPPPTKGSQVPTNSIVDSGTSGILLGQSLITQVSAQLTPTQRTQLATSMQGSLVPTASLAIASWPTLTFVMQGELGDVSLVVKPQTYWQSDVQAAGQSLVTLMSGDEGQAILGLPLLNNYYTVFDGEADGGKGAIHFANIK